MNDRAIIAALRNARYYVGQVDTLQARADLALIDDAIAQATRRSSVPTAVKIAPIPE